MPQSAPAYDRELVHVERRTLVSSTCQYCGFRILGSAPEISDDEWAHREKCVRQRRKKGSASRLGSSEN